jgi:hypothetical protein
VSFRAINPIASAASSSSSSRGGHFSLYFTLL